MSEQQQQQQPSQTLAQAASGSSKDQPDYSTWPTSSLIARITELERQLHSRTAEYAASPGEHPPAGADSQSTADILKQQKDKTETKLANSPSPSTAKKGAQQRPPKPKKVRREIDPSKYNTRFIALKFAYLGQRYNGLEHANGNATPLPTIEEELYKALRKTRLIFPNDTSGDDEFVESFAPREVKPYWINWDGCQYSKAGRTDRGVSAFGQVVGIRVRSTRPMRKTDAQNPDTAMENTEEADEGWDHIKDEHPYVSMLNKVLPQDIRILAWCPNPPEGFDARFSCGERHYKYFFTQPAFSPTPGPYGFMSRANDGTNARPKYREGWLDIEAMREAAKYFEGTHDFRNFCKLDVTKQIESFQRDIFRADIELLDAKNTPLGYVNDPEFRAVEGEQETRSSDEPTPTSAKVYVFNLEGSAFLWHQVRHMVSVLFLVGQGLEPPTIVHDLLDASKNPRKPTYEMASDAPLVLWNCVYPDKQSGRREDTLEWIYAGDIRQIKSHLGKGGGKFGLGGIVEELWAVWRQRKIDEILAGTLLDLAVSQGDRSIVTDGGVNPVWERKNRGQKVFLGDNESRTGGDYIPVMQKRKTELVEVQNARWLAAKQRKTEAGAKPSKMEM
ncbi:pseudouridine synthase DEG1 [Aspergillus saccharolyticus JOP 1030-1]|uniref:Pseudouridylate synthase 3 n=1 Tax=Aspergillus saccharolyticus JOP 1030-1 TaxID=1450539 RepID=A0A318Z9P2_9EURO|nr:pseudouridylate synthase 3 [Aspergillus saccharolyticus JOP 1030-1]PYH40250.1 pseudouridylate synthase 3 [Aspergillus saccharolyticus JOP 1030-1]